MKESKDIIEIWIGVEKWLRDKSPSRYAELQLGAEDRKIHEVEMLMGKSIPDDYKSSLLRHNGNAALSSYTYLSIENAISLYSAMNEREIIEREIDDPESQLIQPKWWHYGWLPFAEDSGGNLLCIDLDPGPKGKFGQILVVEADMGPGPAGFDSFCAWLSDYHDGLQTGRFYADEEGFIYEN